MNLTVAVSGSLFSKGVSAVIQKAVGEEVLDKVSERLKRGGRGAGVRNNTITRTRGALTLDVISTLHSPRNVGRAWQRKNMQIIRSMAPRVVRKAAQRIAAELG